MIEAKGRVLRPQIVTIRPIGKSINKIALYRFDAEDKGDFLPFFNDSNEAPAGLNAFCDYIALVEQHNKLVIMLFELKRGNTSGAEDQLMASYEFMQYVLRSAERIKAINGMQEFNKEEIEFRRILLRRKASNKNITKPKELQNVNKQGIIKCDCDSLLNIRSFI